ncbi:hypothetical protein MTO96_006556 [Rhipicephalus appendiculatus]
MPSLKLIVCIETTDTRLDVTQGEEPRVVPFSSLERLSADVLDDGAAPTPDDVAVVAYSSGPHGAPRGIVATHRKHSPGHQRPWRRSPGPTAVMKTSTSRYLQLAHVFELVAELLAFRNGHPKSDIHPREP